MHQPHRVEDRRLADQDGVVDQPVGFAQGLFARHAHGHAVGNGARALALDRPAGAPRLHHRGRLGGLNRDHPCARPPRFHDPRHAGEERAIAQRNQERVEPFGEREPFQSDSACTFRRFHVEAVLDESHAGLASDPPRFFLGLVEVPAVEYDVRAEFPHALHFERVRRNARVDRQGQAAPSARVRHGLTEISGAGAHHRRSSYGLGDQEVGPSALE